MQALTVSPLTSISQAPQLPVKHPVEFLGLLFLLLRQVISSEANVSMLFGHEILMSDFFNLKKNKI